MPTAYPINSLVDPILQSQVKVIALGESVVWREPSQDPEFSDFGLLRSSVTGFVFSYEGEEFKVNWLYREKGTLEDYRISWLSGDPVRLREYLSEWELGVSLESIRGVEENVVEEIIEALNKLPVIHPAHR
jgi:hypothetical protein